MEGVISGGSIEPSHQDVASGRLDGQGEQPAVMPGGQLLTGLPVPGGLTAARPGERREVARVIGPTLDVGQELGQGVGGIPADQMGPVQIARRPVSVALHISTF